MTRLLPILLLSAIAAPLAAEPIQVSRAVQVGDLDLSTARGVATLEQRLTSAIVEACGEASSFDLEGRNAVRDCQADARQQVASARDRILAKRLGGSAPRLATR